MQLSDQIVIERAGHLSWAKGGRGGRRWPPVSHLGRWGREAWWLALRRGLLLVFVAEVEVGEVGFAAVGGELDGGLH
jgi:hypothetical protein